MKVQLMSSDEELIRKFMVIITTEGDGDGGGDPGDGGDGGGSGDGDPGDSGDDLSTLFSPEEVEAKKTSLAEAKAEEERRAALTDEERAAEDAAAAEAAKGSEIPETYEFTIPEGYTVDESLMADVQAFAKENNMTAAAAQQVADLGAKLLASQQELRETQFAEIREGWLNSAKDDPEIGEDVKKGKDSIAGRAFNTIATPELKDVMDQYGLGDHPEMLRMFYRLSSLMSEDQMHNPTGGAGLPGASGIEKTVGGIFNHPSRQNKAES